MMENYNVRTDLALERKERFDENHIEVKGVILEEEYDEDLEIRTTTVIIETEKGAKSMRKPVGTYLTMEVPNMAVPDEGYHREISMKLARHLKELLEKNKIVIGADKENFSALVVGLGNRKVTPDALGPFVVDQLYVTRHIVNEYGKYAMGLEHANLISAMVPGVMAQTGMETLEMVKGVIEMTHPEVVFAIDALAARNSRRLNRTIQIADTGICPGSGVGNHRTGLNKDTLGVPVIGIGIPTVVDAATIVGDAMENMITAMESESSLKGVGEVLKSYTNAEKYELVQELISPHLNGMFVTPKDVDEMVKQISYTISEGLNVLFANETK